MSRPADHLDFRRRMRDAHCCGDTKGMLRSRRDAGGAIRGGGIDTVEATLFI